MWIPEAPHDSNDQLLGLEVYGGVPHRLPHRELLREKKPATQTNHCDAQVVHQLRANESESHFFCETVSAAFCFSGSQITFPEGRIGSPLTIN